VGWKQQKKSWHHLDSENVIALENVQVTVQSYIEPRSCVLPIPHALDAPKTD
jgi:hypothetical protein